MSFKNVLYKIIAIFVLIIVSTYLYIHIYVYAGSNQLMTIYFLDVGQGDAILIETPNKAKLLIDAGLNSKVLEELGNVLPFFDRSIDSILISHPDGDHIGGFPGVLDAYKVNNLIKGNVFATSTLTQEIEDNLGDGSNTYIVRARDKLILDAKYNVYLEILHPSDLFNEIDKNDASVMMRLVYGETEVMFTGDSSKEIEEYLVSQFGKDLESDVLKVGHHGSNTSTSVSFVGFVNPEHAVISRGCENKFGHPHTEVLETLKNFSVEVHDTCEDGTIIFQTDGEEVFVK